MNRDNFKKKDTLIYAEGSPSIGFGHLFRMKNLIANLNLTNAFCLIENSYQRDFFSSFGIPSIKLLELMDNANSFSFNSFLIDSKENRSELIKSINAKRKILFDSSNVEPGIIDLIISPSFFHSKSLPPRLKDTEHLFGPEYVILDKRIRDNHLHFEKQKLVISFGGSDPNNLSLLILERLSKTSLLDDILLILGPGYSHDLTLLYQYLDKKQIIRNPKNIFDLFRTAFFVITALGVTLQELRYLNVETGIIYNYASDLDDINQINHYFESNKEDTHFYNFGYYKDIQVEKLIKTIKTFKKLKPKKIYNNDIGSAWFDRKVVNKIINHE